MLKMLDYYSERLIDLAIETDFIRDEANYRTNVEFAQQTGIYITDKDWDTWHNRGMGQIWDHTAEELAELIIEQRKMSR